MNLKDAIKTAVRFAEKAKEPSVRQFVRFLPRCGDQPAKVCAQTLRCGVVVSLDEDVPNTLIKAELLAGVAKEAKASIQLVPAAYGGIEIKSGPATWWVHPEEIPQLGWFPEVPPAPAEFRALDGDAVGRVIHAASKDLDQVALRSVRFGLGYVEAIDKARYARAGLGGPQNGWVGVLPAEVFKSLPKGDLEASFAVRLAFLRVGDELRFAPYPPHPFPDCKALIPDHHEGAEAVVDVVAFRRAVKQAVDVSETGSVTLRIYPKEIVVSCWRMEGEPKLFESVVGCQATGDNQLLLSGKNLAEALKIVATPRVRLRYHRPMDPLLMECWGYAEVLWPMLA